MGIACDVYTKLMFKRGYGYPLWEPEPTESGEVLIGDVGYVLDGGFYRTFNATLPADHPVHKEHGVPDGYEPFTYPSSLRHRRQHALEPGPICSKSVTALNVEAAVDIGLRNPGASGRLRFKLSDEQGAVLVLKHEANREALHPCKDLTKYIVANHSSWHQFAQDVFRLDIEEQDIIFVCGWVKTAEWALAAATHSAREGEILFEGEFGPAAKASFSVAATQNVAMSIEHRCGPKPSCGASDASPSSDEGAKFDQCMFMHYYKIKKRRFVGPKVIRGATGEPSSSRRSTPEEAGNHLSVTADLQDLSADNSLDSLHGSLELFPKRQKVEDPLDDILDYILERTDATCAMACDQDLKVVHSEEDYVPDDVYQCLLERPPQIAITNYGVGMLSHHNISFDPESVPPSTRTPPGQRLVRNMRRRSSPGVYSRTRASTPKRSRSRTRSPASVSLLPWDMPEGSASPITPLSSYNVAMDSPVAVARPKLAPILESEVDRVTTEGSLPLSSHRKAVESPLPPAFPEIASSSLAAMQMLHQKDYHSDCSLEPTYKRKRGRPPGSKNKKTLEKKVADETLDGAAAAATSSSPKEQRGSPNDNPPPTSDERRRGRPPKRDPTPDCVTKDETRLTKRPRHF